MQQQEKESRRGEPDADEGPDRHFRQRLHRHIVGEVIVERHRRFDLAAGDVAAKARRIRDGVETDAMPEQLAQLRPGARPQFGQIGVARGRRSVDGVEIDAEEQERVLQMILLFAARPD